jgi:hypothetical protein
LELPPAPAPAVGVEQEPAEAEAEALPFSDVFIDSLPLPLLLTVLLPLLLVLPKFALGYELDTFCTLAVMCPDALLITCALASLLFPLI